ncbi:methyltransferase family protein, partial [Petrimonas sp.]|uniref:methyltransferase family protein n=1 Tax=Petrimonas sp. TaxID=2023866 RepID=UPI003F512A4D
KWTNSRLNCTKLLKKIFRVSQCGRQDKAGLYRYSRNPMYVSFFIYFLGICLLVESWWYAAILMLFQLSVHYLILAEERWCIQQFGDDYKQYMKEVRRYV